MRRREEPSTTTSGSTAGTVADLVRLAAQIRLLIVSFCLVVELCHADTTSISALASGHQAPPTPPAITHRATHASKGNAELSAASSNPEPLVLYSIGNPSDEEQFYLELLNRARANPRGEAQILQNTTDQDVVSAYRYFGVDLNLMRAQFSRIPVAPPLSMNAGLLAAARLHSMDMFTNSFQGHVSSDGRNTAARITAQGYSWSTYGENVYAWAKSVFYGHAGFAVDWGNGPGGMQTPPGHRLNIHSLNFREVGIGVAQGRNGSVGPQLVTQDFANSFGSQPFITGVAYRDLNENHFYDPGEGIGGVIVNVSGATAYAITAPSGGYSVPVSGNGSYEVSFTTDSGVTHQTVSVISSQNVKLDFVPTYSPPIISGPINPVKDRSSTYSFTPAMMATGYQWKQNKRIPFNTVENAEGTLSNLTVATSSGYSVTTAAVSASGNKAFHLVHAQPEDQFITLNAALLVRATSRLIFASRLGWAAPSQVAQAQISTNDGRSWQDVWSRRGNGTAGQNKFTAHTNSLAAFAGAEIRIRFVYDFAGEPYYDRTTWDAGWCIDDVRVTNAEEQVDEIVANASANSFKFNPDAAANYALRVRGLAGSHAFDWGPPMLVSSLTTGPIVQIIGAPVVMGNRVELTFEVIGDVTSGFQVQVASMPKGPWNLDASATFRPLANGLYQVNAAKSGAPLFFYRVISR